MKSQKIILKRNLKNSKKIINSNQVVARTRKFLKRNNKTKKQRGGTFTITENGDIISKQFLSIGMNIPIKENMNSFQKLLIQISPYGFNSMILQNLIDLKGIQIDNGDVQILGDNPNLIVKTQENGLIAKENVNKKRESTFKLTKEKEKKFKYVYEDSSCDLPKIVGNKLLTYVKTLDGNENAVITSDISYILELLEKINSKLQQNNITRRTLELVNNDMNNFQHTDYNIEVNLKNDVKIIGFPDPKHMDPQLNNKLFMKNYDKISKSQKKNYTNWIIEMRNQTPENVENQIDKSKKDEYYKLFQSTFKRFKDYYDYFKKNENNNASFNEEYEKIENRYRAKLNELVNTNIFNRPNIKIKYRFIILQKNPETNQYELMFKNFREIKSEHSYIFEEIQRLIFENVSRMFKILNEGETECKNWMSYVELGKPVEVVAEFLHPTTRLETFSYLYKKRFLLCFILFALSNPTYQNFFQRISFEYPNKDYNLEEFEEEQIEDLVKNSFNGVNGVKGELRQFLLNGHLQNGGNPTKNIIKIEKSVNLEGATIIICNYFSSFDVEIYYKDIEGVYWHMILKANIEQVYRRFGRQLLKKLALTDNKIIHSSKDGSILSYITNCKGAITYELIMHEKVDTDIFTYLLTFPVFIFRKKYDYPFSNKYPKVSNTLLKSAKELLENQDIQEYSLNIDGRNIKYKIKETNGNINYAVKIDNYIFYTNKINLLIVWVFRDEIDENILKTFMYLTDGGQILILLRKILEHLGLFNPQNHRLYVSAFSGIAVNSLHLKIIDYKDYSLPILKRTGINQSTELKYNDVNNIIRVMKVFDNFYKDFMESGKYEWFSPPYFEFLNP